MVIIGKEQTLDFFVSSDTVQGEGNMNGSIPYHLSSFCGNAPGNFFGIGVTNLDSD